MFNARSPIAIDPPSATIPRSNGSRSTRWRRSAEENGKVCTAISPAGICRSPAASCSTVGARMATDHVRTPRIITPSSTACPPIGASRPRAATRVAYLVAAAR
jgi:hypothetical protein